MSVSRSLLLSVVATTATLGLLLGRATPVSAATMAPATAPNTTVSPSRCYMRADWPHASTHQPGRMNGVIRAFCMNVVPRMTHTAQMWEPRWWGWDRIGVKGYVNNYYVRAVSTEANDVCKKVTIRVTGNGYVIDVDSQHYYASVESKHVTNPCGL
jgi:hypothetical protein